MQNQYFPAWKFDFLCILFFFLFCDWLLWIFIVYEKDIYQVLYSVFYEKFQTPERSHYLFYYCRHIRQWDCPSNSDNLKTVIYLCWWGLQSDYSTDCSTSTALIRSFWPVLVILTAFYWGSTTNTCKVLSSHHCISPVHRGKQLDHSASKRQFKLTFFQSAKELHWHQRECPPQELTPPHEEGRFCNACWKK